MNCSRLIKVHRPLNRKDDAILFVSFQGNVIFKPLNNIPAAPPELSLDFNLYNPCGVPRITPARLAPSLLTHKDSSKTWSSKSSLGRVSGNVKEIDLHNEHRGGTPHWRRTGGTGSRTSLIVDVL